MYLSLEQKLGHLSTHHFSYVVRTGMLNAAVNFFRQLGWSETNNQVRGDWGTARFVYPWTENIGPIIQLTEILSRDQDIIEMTENHIALAVHIQPKDAAEIILDWANSAGIGSTTSIEAADSQGSKYFVYIPAIFTFGIELVFVGINPKI